ncbi:MAG: CatB-related O-acetyltransferase [Ruminococcaceae bacterium]|nr:CatB-related O-acetyltransferase [Oscillospiraceae bacterium]
MKFVNWYRTQKSKKSYKKNAQLGENIIFCETGRCTNGSGIRERIKIESNSFVMGSMQISSNGSIEIGDHFYLGRNSLIGSEKSIKIGRCVIISNDVRIYDNNNHPTSPKARENMSLNGFSNDNWAWHHSDSVPVVIEDNVWIGQFCTILKGVTIGKGSIVATRAVVTKDVPPYSIVAGNPAKVVKQIDRE